MKRSFEPLRSTEDLRPVKGLTGPTTRRSAWFALLAVILIPAGLALAAFTLLSTSGQPSSLDDVVLAGPRPPGCVNLVVADDFSGSMTSFTGQRAAAENELVRWSRANLRPDDRMTILAWAGTSTITVPPTRIDQLGTAIGAADLSGLGDGTAAVPMLDLVTQLPDTGCRIALMVISDSEISDSADPNVLRDQLGAAGVQSVALLNPTGAVQSDEWQTLLPFTRVVAVDQSDPQQLSLALGGEVATATGQQLQSRE